MSYIVCTIHHTPYTSHHTFTLNIPYTIIYTPVDSHHTPYTTHSYRAPLPIHQLSVTIHHTPHTIYHTPHISVPRQAVAALHAAHGDAVPGHRLRGLHRAGPAGVVLRQHGRRAGAQHVRAADAVVRHQRAPRLLRYGVWCVVYGVRGVCIVYGVWCVVYGVWRMV